MKEAVSLRQRAHVLVVCGTRPEAVKLAPLVLALRSAGRFRVEVCATGQHRALLDEALHAFGIEPDYDLDAMTPSGGVARLAVNLLARLQEVLDRARPDIVVVQGDTTTTFTAALAAFYSGVAVAHVEAGLRTGDLRSPWPEEANRRLTGVISDLHFAPTERARTNLLREGISAERVFVTGNTGIDALLAMRDRLRSDSALREAVSAQLPAPGTGKRLLLATTHRRESFGARLIRICEALRDLSRRGDVEIVLPVHPNPQIGPVIRATLAAQPNVHLVEPLGYAALVALLERCDLVLTDSGGLQEEAPSLGKPVLVLRECTERTEAVEAGTARLVGTDRQRIVAAANELLDDPCAYLAMSRRVNPFGDGAASARIVDILVGLTETGRLPVPTRIPGLMSSAGALEATTGTNLRAPPLADACPRQSS